MQYAIRFVPASASGLSTTLYCEAADCSSFLARRVRTRRVDVSPSAGPKTSGQVLHDTASALALPPNMRSGVLYRAALLVALAQLRATQTTTRHGGNDIKSQRLRAGYLTFFNVT